MALSLYDAFVPGKLQSLRALSALLDKAEAFCAAQKLAPTEILSTRLIEDMHPFDYQVKSARVHSLGAIEGLRQGSFSPDRSTPPDSFAGLKAMVDDTITRLEAIDPAEIEGFIGQDMAFVAGERRLEFNAEDFLLSFSQPNFYFHVTTAYNLLRRAGLAIGKTDFIGRPRLRPRA